MRNADRVAGEPLPVRGSCLRLWKRAAVKDALYRALTAPSAPRVYGYPMPPAQPVKQYCVGKGVFVGDAAASQRSGGEPRPDALLEAWVGMLRPYFSESDCCFFTGTYRDAYGYPNGITKPDNILRDFKRFLVDQGHDRNAWVVCAEPHQERDIWHCHALLANCDEATRAALKSAWYASRGGADAYPLLDGGVSYCTKYALKGSDSILFDWNLS